MAPKRHDRQSRLRGFKSKLLNASSLSLLGSGSASAAACGTTRTRRATGGRTSTRGGSSTSRGSSRPSRSSSPTDTASARTSSDPSSRTSEISGGRSSDSGRTDFTPGKFRDIRKLQSIATEIPFFAVPCSLCTRGPILPFADASSAERARWAQVKPHPLWMRIEPRYVV